MLQPNQTDPREAELAVCPSSRAAAVYVLCGERRFGVVHAGVRDRLRELDGVDLFAWLEHDATPVRRGDADGPPPSDCTAVVVRDGTELRFRPGSQVTDRRGAGWDLDGDPAALAATVDGDELRVRPVPGRARPAVGGAHRPPRRGDPDLGRAGLGAAWTGAAPPTARAEATAPCTPATRWARCCCAGSSPGTEQLRSQWAIRDVAGLVLRPLRHRRRRGRPARADRARGERGRELAMGTSEHAAVTEPPAPAVTLVRRVHHGARQPANWIQLLKFGLVGGSGYAVNLAVFAILTGPAEVHHIPAAIGAFCVAVASNFAWNRLWTFDAERRARRLPGGAVLRREPASGSPST